MLRDKPAELVACSPKATVPVLIMRRALQARDPQGWVRVDEQAEVHALIDLNEGPFKQTLDRYN